MKVSLKTGMPIMALGSLLTISSCSNNPLSTTKDYMKNTERTQMEFDKLTNGINPDNSKSLTIMQSRLDSMAYRDLFNTTSASKSPSKVAEFNKIAAKYRADFAGDTIQYQRFYDGKTDYETPKNSLINKLTNSNISIKEMDEIKSSGLSVCDLKLWRLQHLTDNWAYKKFFEKIGVFKGDFPKNFEKITKQIKP